MHPTRFLRVIFRHLPPAIVSFLFPIVRYLLSDSAHDPRWHNLEKAFETVRHIEGTEPGDYLEFGVFYGKSFTRAYMLARNMGLQKMRYFAFDSFEGLPYAEGEFQIGGVRASRDFFTKYIRAHGVDTRRVTTIEGNFTHSLTKSLKETHKLEKAAVVHIDCDLYESTKDVLLFIESLLRPNSIIIFDDWHAFDYLSGPEEAQNMGQQKAFMEWSLNHRFQEFYDAFQARAFVMW